MPLASPDTVFSESVDNKTINEGAFTSETDEDQGIVDTETMSRSSDQVKNENTEINDEILNKVLDPEIKKDNETNNNTGNNVPMLTYSSELDNEGDVTVEVPEDSVEVASLRRSNRSKEKVDYRELHRKGVQHHLVHKLSKTKSKKVIIIKMKDMFRKVAGIMMTQVRKDSEHRQMNVKESVKKYGEDAVKAVLTEYAQLNDYSTFKPILGESLSWEKKKQSLDLITLVTKKRNGTVKGRACANGKKQRRYISKEEVTSPTVQLESLMLSILIDSYEGRNVATADVKGAYLLSDMKDFVVVRVHGEALNIMLKVQPEYNKFLTVEKGKKVLYLQLLKALYGCVQSALRW